MITKISIKNIASYGENPAILETHKKVNLIYGLNGAGKTVFSNFLANKDDTNFSNCLIEGLNNEKILVYNQNFIENNFYQKDTQKGIFTLSSKNKEAEEKIETATNEIKELNLELKNGEKNTGLEIDLEKKKTEINNLSEKSKEKTWEIKTTYSGGDRILEFCLEGKRGSQDSLFEYIRKIQKTEEKPEKTVEELKEEAEATQGENAKIYDEKEIEKSDFYFLGIEENKIFSEVIVGNENLQIADLIKQLDNADWVKQGLSYMAEPKEKEGHEEIENEKCPLCQKKTISKKIYEQIQSYFDKSYQEKITELKSLNSEYFSAWQKVKDNETELLKNDFIKNRETEFKLLYKNFTEKLSSNWSKTNEKIKTPSKVVILESTILEKDGLNNFFEEIIKEIKAHNLKVKNKKKTKKEIVNNFWEIMRWDYDQTIENYNSQNKILNQKKTEIEKNVLELNTKINEQKEIIRLAQKENINIDEAINNIKIELKFLGIDNFTIEKEDEFSYKIKRGSEDNAKFKTLSEGEKTIISFLYFLELCKGKESEDEAITEKIIVVDDPISSLSHIYIFNIAQLIKNTFFTDKYKQIFVLTHSLYFFHELITISNSQNLFRIIKPEYSTISSLEKDDIQNEYQSYWQILKDHNNGNSSDSLLANSMRNILEYFFGFIDKNKFNESIKQIESESEYQFFTRYVQRESHSDFTNITDMKEIDSDIFKKAFKEIFIKAGYEEHYNKMIS